MTVAVLNPSLVSIEDLLGRTLVYGGLSVLIVGDRPGRPRRPHLLLGDALAQRQVVLIVLLLSVVLYGPLRLRLWRGGTPADARRARQPLRRGRGPRLDAWSRRRGAGPAGRRREGGGVGVRRAASSASRSTAAAVSASWPPTASRPAETRTLPITYRDTEVGRLVLPARGLRSRLSRRDEQLLGDLVRQAATAARTGRLAEELQDSRERLVVAREEERRRIRRDLHDGLGPSLSGVVFQLESARLLVDRDPAAAREPLAATSAHVQDVVADVRRLVHDLRPPALDDRGPGRRARPAGRAAHAAARPSGSTADDLGALPAAVEVAAYRIVGEALTNVGPPRGGASRCTIRLAEPATSCSSRWPTTGSASPRRRGRRRPGVVARARRRARRPQRGHLSRRRRHRRPGLATPEEQPR